MNHRKNAASRPAGSPWPLTPPPPFSFLGGFLYWEVTWDFHQHSCVISLHCCHRSCVSSHYTSTISQVVTLPVSSGFNLPHAFPDKSLIVNSYVTNWLNEYMYSFTVDQWYNRWYLWFQIWRFDSWHAWVGEYWWGRSHSSGTIPCVAILDAATLYRHRPPKLTS